MLLSASKHRIVRLLLGGGIPLAIFATTIRITTHVSTFGYRLLSAKCCAHVQNFFKDDKNASQHHLHSSREIDVVMNTWRNGNKNNFSVKSEVPWKKQLELVRKMRKRTKHAVEVDWAGTGALKSETQQITGLNATDVRFSILISAMLSSQTKDPVTAEALRRLRSICSPQPLSARALLRWCEIHGGKYSLATIIHPVSFHKTKAKYIISTCIALCESWGGDIPRTPEGLLSLKGVGPKVMILVTDLAWGECVGICVDTHVHRIAGRLGWVEVTKQPEMTRMQLEAWLPLKFWPELNSLFVGFGQMVCTARKPKCHSCAVREYCPWVSAGSENGAVRSNTT